MIRCLPLLSLMLVSHAFAIDWQGHRGARGLYPENTIGAMQEALKYPVTTLELDVVVSKDMQVVVSHEPWMHEDICQDPKGNRVKGKKHNLFKMTYEEISKYDCGILPHPRFPQQRKVSEGKPTLERLISVMEETLKGLNRSQVEYNIEIKSTPEDERDGYQPDIKTFSDLVIQTIKKQLPVSKFTIQSFDWRVLQYLHQAHGDVRLVALTEDSIDVEDDLKKLGFNPYVYSPYFKKLKKKHVEAFHKLGIKVIPWTVNEVDDMKEMLEMKVDGIITDYPNLIIETLPKAEIPKNAVPSDKFPGWDCKEGYVQKRNSCTRIKIPSHAHLTSDGKNWECDEGFIRYRSKCTKKK